ncbi:MAG: hypothetical protein NZ529_00385 [Cytophagaceae bacterium]|nr:hypothetical protein [Cytophagaceae bacterium]MDW8455221.1 hypothetical protein [Cytophagaceae bacterium]
MYNFHSFIISVLLSCSVFRISTPVSEADVIREVLAYYKEKSASENAPQYTDLNIVVKKIEKAKSTVEKYNITAKVSGICKPPVGKENMGYEEKAFEEILVFRMFLSKDSTWVSDLR